MKLDYTTLLVKSFSPHLRVHINRPEKRNALNRTVVEELTGLLELAETDNRIKTVTLSGEGDAFCSGADLEYLLELRKFDADRNKEDSRNLARMYHTLYALPKPVIALVNGPAVAGGCGLASACDIIIASEQAKFGYPEVRIGFVAAIVSIFLIRQIGERKAKELLLTGKLIPAEEAYRIGLVNRIVPHVELNRELVKWQTMFQENAPSAMSYTKELFSTFQYVAPKQILDIFTDLNAEVRQTPEFKEGLSAFLDKRKPNWN